MSVLPLDYAPDVKPPEEFVTQPTDPEDERIEVGVVGDLNKILPKLTEAIKAKKG